MRYLITAQEARASLRRSEGISTVRRVPLRIEVQVPRKRWFWRRSYHVRIHLLNEQGVSLRWTGVTQSLGAICASLGVKETDAVWQRTPFTEAGTQDQQGWTPFLFF